MSGTGLAAVEELLQFGVCHKLIEYLDIVQVRNQLYELLRYSSEEIDPSLFVWEQKEEVSAASEFGAPTSILTTITCDYIARGHMPDDTVVTRDLLEAAIMGLLMPRQSETAARFKSNYTKSPKRATDDFYAMCRAANYIQVERIKKDMYWTADTEYGVLELTVNLSKPEKDPKDIEAERLQPAATYPKCLLCLENVGFAGTRAWPARQNLRVIPVTLDGGRWYFQYSPYAYYNEHCIVFSEKHKPMEMTEATFRQLVDFVTKFPHYFLGSNADLPIVGGSILSHEHFQGGRHVFPMEKAESYQCYTHEKYPNVHISLVKWPLSVIRLSAPVPLVCSASQNSAPSPHPDIFPVPSASSDGSNGMEELIGLAAYILAAWREYSEGDVVAYTADTPHNTITPIARIKEGRLEMDLVLRNNRTSDQHPLGIFHPHAEWHHVKKENIGLIEVMGLAVLPGRLKDEIEDGMFNKQDIAHIFVQVLKDCGVFKDNEEGRKRFDIFMKSLSMGVAEGR